MNHLPESVTMTNAVRHAPHYRTPVLAYPSPVYVVTSRAGQPTHEHYFEGLTRFGDAFCHGCGASAWAAMWVADGVFGEGTDEWLTGRIRAMDERVDQTVMALLQRELGAIVIEPEPTEPKVALLADLDTDTPASPFGPVRKWGLLPKKERHLRVVR